MQGIKIGINPQDIMKVKQDFNKLVDEMNKNSRINFEFGDFNANINQMKNEFMGLVRTIKGIDLTKNTSMLKDDLVKTAGTIDEIVKAYEKLGKVSQPQKFFDSNGNLNKFVIELERAEGLIEKISYRAKESIGSYNELSPQKFEISSIVESDRSMKVLEKNLKDEARAREKEINTRKKLEQDYENWWLKNLKDKEIANNNSIQEYQNKLKGIQTTLSTSKLPAENANFKELVDKYNELNNIIIKIKQNESILTSEEKKDINDRISDIKRLNVEYENSYKKQIYLENLGQQIDVSNTHNVGIRSPQSDFSSLVKEIGGANAEIKKIDIQPFEKYGEEIRKITYRVKDGKDKWHEYQVSMVQAGSSGEMSFRKLDLGMKDVITRQVGLLGRMKHAFESVFSFSLVSGSYFALINELRKAVQYVVEMDTALTNLNKVVDLSKSQMEDMKQSAMELGKQLGQSSIEIMKGFAEYGRVTKNLGEIKELTKTAIMSANVTDLSVADSAKSLITAMINMNIPFKDSITILNSWNQIQNNFRVSASDLAHGLESVGSIAKQTGTDINTLNGYIASLVSSQGIDGAESGTAIKSFISRIYRLGSEGAEDKGKAEKTLNSIGVAVRDSSGQFRKFSDIIEDTQKRFKSLSSTEAMAVSQAIGG